MSALLSGSIPSILSTVTKTLFVIEGSLLSWITPAGLKNSTFDNGTCNWPKILFVNWSSVFGNASVTLPEAPGPILVIFLLILLSGTYVPENIVLGVAIICSLLQRKTIFDKFAFLTII